MNCGQMWLTLFQETYQEIFQVGSYYSVYYIQLIVYTPSYMDRETGYG